jgi:uncharacterized protein with PQ loop repeat
MLRNRIVRIVLLIWLIYGIIVEVVAPPPTEGEFPPRLRPVEVPPEVQEVIAHAVSP